MMDKKTYRVDEVAAELAVSRRTVERAIKSGELQAFKIRDSIRVDADELTRIKKKEPHD